MGSFEKLHSVEISSSYHSLEMSELAERLATCGNWNINFEDRQVLSRGMFATTDGMGRGKLNKRSTCLCERIAVSRQVSNSQQQNEWKDVNLKSSQEPLSSRSEIAVWRDFLPKEARERFDQGRRSNGRAAGGQKKIITEIIENHFQFFGCANSSKRFVSNRSWCNGARAITRFGAVVTTDKYLR